MAAPKFGTLVPNRIFVGGISANTSEAELTQLFSAYGNVKATKIISDRAGVSKGYGFVTFETDEEARRLQQESECIILRERKLNIAPAIKKQPFNRPYDSGSGSPPAAPTSTYYYTNGTGLGYHSGMAFYNTGAAPSTPIATPADSTAIYHSSGIFGPQSTSSHQSFAPMVYSCPTPSLYMPQQFQYSPMSQYEPYYATASAGSGLSQYSLYATSSGTNSHDQLQSQPVQSNGCVPGNAGASNASAGGANGTNVSHSPALASLVPPSSHFYASSALPPASRHHQPLLVSGPVAPPPQLDQLYYSFAAPGPPQAPPQTISIGDQQLLLYTNDPTNCQQLATPLDSQASTQEVQIYATGLQAQSRYYQQQVSHQQQPVGQRRLPGTGQSIASSRKLPGCGSQSVHGDHLRRTKSKLNVMTQGGVPCKMQDGHCVGGGGDATGSNVVNMLPITPPPTPTIHSSRATIDSVNNTGIDTATGSEPEKMYGSVTLPVSASWPDSKKRFTPGKALIRQPVPCRGTGYGMPDAALIFSVATFLVGVLRVYVYTDCIRRLDVRSTNTVLKNCPWKSR